MAVPEWLWTNRGYEPGPIQDSSLSELETRLSFICQNIWEETTIGNVEEDTIQDADNGGSGHCGRYSFMIRHGAHWGSVRYQLYAPARTKRYIRWFIRVRIRDPANPGGLSDNDDYQFARIIGDWSAIASSKYFGLGFRVPDASNPETVQWGVYRNNTDDTTDISSRTLRTYDLSTDDYYWFCLEYDTTNGNWDLYAAAGDDAFGASILSGAGWTGLYNGSAICPVNGFQGGKGADAAYEMTFCCMGTTQTANVADFMQPPATTRMILHQPWADTAEDDWEGVGDTSNKYRNWCDENRIGGNADDENKPPAGETVKSEVSAIVDKNATGTVEVLDLAIVHTGHVSGSGALKIRARVDAGSYEEWDGTWGNVFAGCTHVSQLLLLTPDTDLEWTNVLFNTLEVGMRRTAGDWIDTFGELYAVAIGPNLVRPDKTPAVGVIEELSGTIAAVASLSGEVFRTRPVSGLVPAVASLSGLLYRTRPISGQIFASAALSGSLYRTRPLSGLVPAVASLSANLYLTWGLSGTIAAASTLSANMHPFRGLSGTIAATASLSGLLYRVRDINGDVEAVTTLAANLYVIWSLKGTTAAVSHLIAVLETIISEPFRPPVGQAVGDEALAAHSHVVEGLAAQGIIATPILPGRGEGSRTPAAYGRVTALPSGLASGQYIPRPGSAGVAPGTAPVETVTIASHGRYQQSNDDLYIETGFQPDAVWIGSDDDSDGSTWCARLRITTSDQIMRFAGGLVSSQIKSFDSGGFTLTGGAGFVNQGSSGYYYNWVAWRSAPGACKVGKYLGDGEATQEITGLGFQPDVVMVCRESDWATMRAIMLTDTLPGAVLMTTTHPFLDDGIVSLDADGFTVDLQRNGYTNTDGMTYHYIALKKTEGLVATGTYSGDDADDRDIGVGFEPILATVHGYSAPVLPSVMGVWRSTDWPADPDKSSGRFDRNAALANAIQDLTTAGFQIGSHDFVNDSAKTYHWVAIKDECTSPGELEGRGYGIRKDPLLAKATGVETPQRGRAGTSRTMEGEAETDRPPKSGKAR